MMSIPMERRWLLSLTLFNTLILCFCGLPSVLTDPIPHAVLSVTYFIIAYIAQNFLFAGTLGLVLWPLFYLIRSHRLKIILAVPLEMLLLFFCYMNAKVFSFWRLHINTALIHMYFSKGGGSQVFEVSHFMYTWIFCAVISFFMLSVLLVVLSKKMHRFFHFASCFAVFAGCYVVAQGWFIVLCAENATERLQYSLKIPYFYDFSWVNVLQSVGVPVFPKDSLASQIDATISESHPLHYPLHPLHYVSPKQKLNVLLIVVDTLRYDMINPINMPHVFHFSQHANRFLDNISGGDCTRPGIFSLFYGIPATYWHDALQYHQGSIIIRAFQSKHYQLGLYASAPLLTPPFDQTVFETVKHLQTITPGATPLARDEKITQEMQHFLNHAAHNHHPFFGFMFYDAPHAYNAIPLHRPFHPIDFLNYFDVDDATPPTPIFNLYKNAVFADDQLIQTIFDTLRKDHLDNNTVVILTADHGQEFNEYHNNYWEHASGFSKYQMRTPMLIAWPGMKSITYHHQTTHFDLTPTLLHRVLGVTNPVSDYSVGDDFFSQKQPQFVIAGNYAYYALVMQKTIVQFHDFGLHRTTDDKMDPLVPVKMDPVLQREFLREMRIYSVSTRPVDVRE